MSNIVNNLRNHTQLVTILGLSISGLSAIISSYDAVGQVSQEEHECIESAQGSCLALIKSTRQNRFIFILVLSCLAIVGGVVYSNYLKHNGDDVITYSLSIGGIVGIVYSLLYKYNGISSWLHLAASWTVFIAFLVAWRMK